MSCLLYTIVFFFKKEEEVIGGFKWEGHVGPTWVSSI